MSGRLTESLTPTVVDGWNTDPMTTRTQQLSTRRWVLDFLAALVAVLATILSAVTASAATTAGAETRVRASSVVVEVPVGPPDSVVAGQRLGRAVAGQQIVVATGVAANSAGDVSTVLMRTPLQLQKKFKHAGDFGVTGGYSKANASRFSAAMHQHMNASGTQRIVGTYRNAPATHYLDPKTGLNVLSDLDGNFITGFRLGAGQLNDVLTTGRLW